MSLFDKPKRETTFDDIRLLEQKIDFLIGFVFLQTIVITILYAFK